MKNDSCERQAVLKGDRARHSHSPFAGRTGADGDPFAAVHEPHRRCMEDIARATGVGAPNVASEWRKASATSARHTRFFAFALACSRRSPGDRVLLAGFGSGCDALVFEMTGPMPGADRRPKLLTRGSSSTITCVSSASTARLNSIGACVRNLNRRRRRQCSSATGAT